MSRMPSAMAIHRESLTPWIGASLVAMGAYVAGVLVGVANSSAQQLVLTVCLCAVVTSTQLVLYRTRRLEEEVMRDYRARPSTDELMTLSTGNALASGLDDHGLPPYAAGMLRYAEAVVELLEHAVDVALTSGENASELASGRDDAAALVDLLSAMGGESVQLSKAAKVHTICSLWEAHQEHLEQVAAEIDPEYHRRWRARHIAALRLRHGEAPSRTQQALPYLDVSAEE